MEDLSITALDRGIAHALQIDGRVSFRALADVVGVSEQTVARRYRRMRAAGVLRVVGTLAGPDPAHVSWTVRLRCTPDAAAPMAAALAKRDDTRWVHLVSAGTEISCVIQSRTSVDGEELVLEKLPRTNKVLAVTAHSVLRAFVTPEDWAGLRYLTEEQVARLERHAPVVADTDEPVEVTEADQPLVDLLASDGRATYAQLAQATGWSESTVKRRLVQLRSSRAVRYMVDIPPKALGYRTEARLWMSVRPSELVATARELSTHAESMFVGITTGPANLLTTVACRGPGHLYHYLTERVGALTGVQTLETAPIVRTFKQAGTVLAT